MKKTTLLLLTVFLSLHSFAQWQVTSGPHGAGITNSLAVQDTFMYAGSQFGGIFVSTDQGDTWTASNNGLTNMNDVRALAINDTNIFAGINYSLGGPAVFKSTDQAANWASTPLQFLFLFSLAIKPPVLIAGTWNGVSVSTDNGSSWNDFTAGLPSNASVFSLAFSGTKIFGGINSSSVGGTGVFASVNNGTNWTAFNTGLPASTVVDKVVVMGSDVYAGTATGVYKSGDAAPNWSAVSTGLTNTTIRSFHVVGTDLFAGTESGIFLTGNGGANWIDISGGLPASTKIYSIASDSTYMYVGTDSVVWRRPLFQITGMPEKNNSSQMFSIYPNPATKDFLVTFGDEQSGVKGNYELNMIDLAGKNILHRSLQGVTKSVIDVSEFPQGIYLIKVTDGEKRSVTKKLVKM